MADTDIIVDCGALMLRGFGNAWPCAIGRAGAVPAAAKREGDGATPIGRWPLRGALLRPDRGLMPPPGLPWRWIRPWDGWCDDTADIAYNRPVAHPHTGSAEHLWRDDAAYDLVIVLGYNDAPAQPNAGSAIFWHLAQPDFRPTEGCIAVTRAAMQEMLPHLQAGMVVATCPADISGPP